jgi:excisionase family DNA binding protein
MHEHQSRAAIITAIGARQVAVGRPHWRLWSYLLWIAAAELLTSLVNLNLGLTVHAVLLVVLIVRGAVGRADSERRLTLALALGPLIRLLSLTLPLSIFPQLAWYPIVSTPLLLATWIIVRQLGVSRQDLGLRPTNIALQLMLTGGGLGLGAIEYYILVPGPLVAVPSWKTFLYSSLILLIFTGFTEEVIFRGLIQSMSMPILGRWALIYTSLLFAVLHIGYLSITDVVFVFFVGIVFAYIVRWSGTILGVTLAHGMTNTMLFLIMPVVAQQPTRTSATLLAWAIWGGSLMAIIAIVVLAVRNLSYQNVTTSVRSLGADIRAAWRDIRTTLDGILREPIGPAQLLATMWRKLRTMIVQHLDVRALIVPLDDEPPRYTIREAASHLELSESTVRRWIKTGRLAAERHGKRWMVLLPQELPPDQEAAEPAVSHTERPAPVRRTMPRPDLTFLQSRTHQVWQSAKSRLSQFRSDVRSKAGDRGQTTMVFRRLFSVGEAWIEQIKSRTKQTASAIRTGIASTLPLLNQGQFSRIWVSAAALLIMCVLIGPTLISAWNTMRAAANPEEAAIRPSANMQRYATMTLLPATQLATAAPPALIGAQPAPTEALTASPTILVTMQAASAAPAPTATLSRLAPTEAPSPTAASPTPADVPLSAEAMLQRFVAARAALRTGQLQAVLDYGTKTRASAQIDFDLGDKHSAPRFHMVTSYAGVGKALTTELIVIGDKAWQRQQDAPWTVAAEQPGAWEQVAIYLPAIDSTMDLKMAPEANTVTLHWYDAGRDADVTLEVDPVTGVPYTLHQTPRATGLALTVIYSAWNHPIKIIAPDTN